MAGGKGSLARVAKATVTGAPDETVAAAVTPAPQAAPKQVAEKVAAKGKPQKANAAVGNAIYAVGDPLPVHLL